MWDTPFFAKIFMTLAYFSVGHKNRLGYGQF